MGSGVTKTGNISKTCVKLDTNLDNQLDLLKNKIHEIDGNLYMKIEREEYKLKPKILKGFANFNNFSRDTDDEFPTFK